MKFVIKWRFVIKMGVLLLALGVAIHFVHRYQVERQVGVFLREADRSRDASAEDLAKGNLKQASADRERELSFLTRYIMARPDDVDARERRARLLCQIARTQKELMGAFVGLEDVLRRDPGRDKLREFTIDFAIDRVRLPREAIEHIDTLLKLPNQPNSGKLKGRKALCLLIIKEYVEAEKIYMESLKHAPELLQSYEGLALVRRVYLKKDKEAKKTIDDMVRNNKDNFRAHLIEAGYWREFGRPGEPEHVEPAIEEALRLAPEELDVLLAAANLKQTHSRRYARAGEWLSSLGALTRAKGYLGRAIEKYPLDNKHPEAVRAHLAMASLEAERMSVADALAVVGKGLKALPDSSDLLVGQMEYLFRAGDVAEATKTVDKLRELGILAPHLVRYERARILILEEEWVRAAREFEELVPQLEHNLTLFREANLFLGRCYLQLSENDRAVSAFTRAAPLEATDPVWLFAMEGLAEAQTRLGQLADALATYHHIKNLTPGGLVGTARLELLLALRSPEGKANWTAAEEALAAAEKAVTDRMIDDFTEVKFLRATLTHFRGKPEEAHKQLEALKVQRPKKSAVWVELAMQEARQKDYPKALATLAAGEKELGDSVGFRLARAEIWAISKEPDLAKKLLALAAGREKLPKPEQRRLLRGLAELASSYADDAAGRLWDDLADLRPFDLSVQLVRFDRAIRAKNPVATEAVLKIIGEIDGETGQAYRLAWAITLVERARAAEDRALRGDLRQQALAILDALEKEGAARSRAGRLALSQGLVHDLNARDAEDLPNKRAREEALALEHYRHAVSLGETNPEALRRAMELLTLKGQFAEATGIFEKLPDATKEGESVQRLAAMVSLQTDKVKEAVVYAVKGVPETSTNYKDWIWLGRVYWSAGDRTKPEAMFRKATVLAPDAMDAWLVLISYLTATDRAAEAAKTFEAAKDKVKKSERILFLALGYAQLGETEKAVEAYKQARLEKPTDVLYLLAEAEYLLQLGRLADARAGFQRVIDLPQASEADRAIARQRLILAVAADPDYDTSRKAIDLLAANPAAPAGEAETPGQRRARAVILALQRDRASKLEAIRLLKENSEGRSPSEQFLLAQLLNGVGERREVRVVMADLLKSDRNKLPVYMRFYAMWLLRQGEGDVREAEEWVRRLIKSDPDSLPTAELKARVAAAKKDLGSARAALLPKADLPNAPVGLIARLCEELGFYADAEQLMKRYVQENQAKEPRAVLALAAYYGRPHKNAGPVRTAEALRICEQARATVPAPAVGEIAIRVLYNAPTAAKEDMARVGTWLEEAAGKAAGNDKALLLEELAAVRNLQGDYEGSAALYRQVLAANPRDALAMNNLAYLLSAREGKHDEGLALLEQAKRVIGPSHPTLLGTEAMIRTKKGEPALAIGILQTVVVEAPTGSAYFNLARAELAAKHDAEARQAWRRAAELGLAVGDLHPLERPGYEELAKKFLP